MKSKLNFYKITFCLSLLTFNFSACSSPAPKTAPSEQITSAEANIVKSGSKANAPQALDPDPRKSTNSDSIYPMVLMGKEFALAAALVGAARGLAKIGKTEKPREDLNGTCIYGEPENSAIVSPCVNATVQLIDKSGEVKATSMTNRSGDFRFFIPANETYTVQVLDKKGRSAKVADPVGRSNYVSIFLKP